VVCQEKNNGSLGVKNIKVVNFSLLAKWRCRFLKLEDEAFWKDVLVAKNFHHL
jgi:hypothetical protein